MDSKKDFTLEPRVHTLFEASTQTWQWVVADPVTLHAAIIDPVLDKRADDSGISTAAADRILDLVHEQEYQVQRILETHTQRNAKTASWYLRSQLRDKTGRMPRICTGKSIVGVQRMFARQYGIQDAGWSQKFDSFRDGQKFDIGNLQCQVLHLSGPEPDCYAFVIGHHVFIGDVTHGSERTSATIVNGVVTPSFQRQGDAMRRLREFASGYLFHPPGGEGQTNDDIRPQTAATEVSTWQHDPVTPKASISIDRRMASPPPSYQPRPQRQIHEMA